MSNGINVVVFGGNLGVDPEYSVTQGGQQMLKLRIAANESYKDNSGERKEHTEWGRTTIWGPRAEALARILKKGDFVIVRGSMRTSSYEKDGEKKFTTEIFCHDLTLTGKRSDSAPADAGERAPQGNGSRQQYNRQATPQQRQAPRSGGNGAGSARAPADPQEPAESDGGGFGGDDDIPFICRASGMRP